MAAPPVLSSYALILQTPAGFPPFNLATIAVFGKKMGFHGWMCPRSCLRDDLQESVELPVCNVIRLLPLTLYPGGKFSYVMYAYTSTVLTAMKLLQYNVK